MTLRGWAEASVRRSAASPGSRISSVAAASLSFSGFALALKCRTFWMYSESDADAERSVASEPPAADGGVAARGPRAAHPASSVTASATDVVLTNLHVY